MRKLVFTGTVGLAIIFAATIISCGPPKPTGSEYLGKWKINFFMEGYSHACTINVAMVNKSFLFTNEWPKDKPALLSHDQHCEIFEGLFTLTPEGNLKKGDILISKVEGKNQAVVSGLGKVAYLRKVM